jgi:hypothetical protein
MMRTGRTVSPVTRNGGTALRRGDAELTTGWSMSHASRGRSRKAAPFARMREGRVDAEAPIHASRQKGPPGIEA